MWRRREKGGAGEGKQTGQRDGAKVNIVFGLRRTIHHDGAGDASGVLGRIVRVIPRGAVERSNELVGIRRPRSDGALGDAGHTILPRSVDLQETMPMNAGSLGGTRDVVVDGDNNLVTPVGLDGGTRECSVDEKHLSFVTVRGDHPTADGEIIVPRHPCVGVPRVRIGVGVCP